MGRKGRKEKGSLMLQPEHEATIPVITQLCVSYLYVLQKHFAEAFLGPGSGSGRGVVLSNPRERTAPPVLVPSVQEP